MTGKQPWGVAYIPPLMADQDDGNGPRVIWPPTIQCEAPRKDGQRCGRRAEYYLHGFQVCHTHRFGAGTPPQEANNG